MATRTVKRTIRRPSVRIVRRPVKRTRRELLFTVAGSDGIVTTQMVGRDVEHTQAALTSLTEAVLLEDAKTYGEVRERLEIRDVTYIAGYVDVKEPYEEVIEEAYEEEIPEPPAEEKPETE